MDRDCNVKLKGDKGTKGRRQKQQDKIYNSRHIRMQEAVLQNVHCEERTSKRTANSHKKK